jgi:hypothetical protein
VLVENGGRGHAAPTPNELGKGHEKEVLILKILFKESNNTKRFYIAKKGTFLSTSLRRDQTKCPSNKQPTKL